MPSLTREQFNKWNGQAGNGFKFDIQMYVIWNEKRLAKEVKQPDGTIIRFMIHHMPEYEGRYKATGRHIPTLSAERLIPTHTEGCYSVHRIGEDLAMAEPEKTRKYATLCRISKEIDTDEYIKNLTENAA